MTSECSERSLNVCLIRQMDPRQSEITATEPRNRIIPIWVITYSAERCDETAIGDSGVEPYVRLLYSHSAFLSFVPSFVMIVPDSGKTMSLSVQVLSRFCYPLRLVDKCKYILRPEA